MCFSFHISVNSHISESFQPALSSCHSTETTLGLSGKWSAYYGLMLHLDTSLPWSQCSFWYLPLLYTIRPTGKPIWSLWPGSQLYIQKTTLYFTSQNNTTLTFFDVKYGVHQGIILVPLYFSVYISLHGLMHSPLGESVSTVISVVLYVIAKTKQMTLLKLEACLSGPSLTQRLNPKYPIQKIRSHYIIFLLASLQGLPHHVRSDLKVFLMEYHKWPSILYLSDPLKS